MPKPILSQAQKDSIQNEVFRQISDFVHDKDYDGLYHFMRQTLDDIEHGDPNTVEYVQNSHRRNSISNCFENMMGSDDAAQLDFLKHFFVFCTNMENSRFMETGKTYDRTLKSLQNGEIKNAELIRGEEKLTQEMALLLTLNGTAAGRKLSQAKGITAMLTQAISRNDHYRAFKKDADAILQEEFAKDKSFNKEEHNRYYQILNKPPQISVRDEGLSDRNLQFMVDMSKTDLSFTRIPDGITSIQNMNAGQLKEYKARVMAQKKAIERFESSAKNWSRTAETFYHELRDALADMDLSPEQKALLKALKNAADVQKGNYSYGKNETGKYCFSAIQIREKSVFFTLDDVSECANALKDTMPELSAKILSAVAESQKNITAAFKGGADKVFDVYKNDAKQAQIKMLSRRIERIEKQEQILAIEAEAPNTARGMRQRQRGMGEMDNLQNTLEQFVADTIDILQVTKAVNTFFQKDKASRDLTKGGKHTEYNKMLSSLEELQKLREQNLKDFSYEEITEKIKKACDAADSYVKTHDGVFNIASGWSSEGRSRIANARYIHQKLKRQLQEMTSNYQKDIRDNRQSLAEYEKTISETRESLHNEQIADQNAVISKINKKFLSASLQSVHKKLTSIPGEMPEDKEKIGDLCAELLAIKGMHSPKKENDGKPIEMLNERKLEERKSEIKASPGFQNMLQKHSTQELYQAATDRTQNTLSGLLDKNEADIKLKTNKKVTKAL